MRNILIVTVALVAALTVLRAQQPAPTAGANPQAQPASSRRSQRIKMQDVRVASPDGKLALTFAANAERLNFAVTLESTPVLDASSIAMMLDGYDLSTGVVLTNVEARSGEETFPWLGARSTASNRYNAATLSITNDLTSTPYTIEVRVFDDGVAYRHVVPGGDAVSRVPDEYSTFAIPAGATVWYGGLADGHYETPYVKKDIADVRAGEWAGPPLTYKLASNAGYASITEANLVNYSGMGLEADGRRGWTIGLGHRQPLNYPFELRYGRDEGKRLGRAAAVTGTITTPWRVVLIGRDLNTLVGSTVIPSLCPPADPRLFPQGIKTPWIKPGRAVWRYLDGGAQTVDGMKDFSRMAAELGFEHHVMESLWSRWTDDERKDVVAYSKERHVDLFWWKHSNQLRTPDAQEEFFRMLESYGVAGAKIDFFDHEAKEVVDLYETLLRKAAEHHVMLVFHGANKPTGRARTWPNEMVREAVRGMESSALMERARHQTILPFTRLLAGPADYTTMLFTERRRDTSVANQIASMAVFDAPLLTIAANPQSLLANPAVDVIKSIPPTWDDTIVLPWSEIGELAAYARRFGDMWIVAVMNGPAPKALRIPLSFLGSGRYSATTVRDGGDDATVVVGTESHTAADTITLDLRAGGGFVAKLNRAR